MAGDFDFPIDRIAEDLRSEFRRVLERRIFRNPLRYDAELVTIFPTGRKKANSAERVHSIQRSSTQGGSCQQTTS